MSLQNRLAALVSAIKGDFDGLDARIIALENAADYTSSSLFSSGQDGILGLLTGQMYQESVAATLAASHGDPVGILVESHAFGGLTLPQYSNAQPEKIVNGAFATDTDWTKSAAWTIGSGVATCDGVIGEIKQTVLTVGIYAQTTFDITSRTTGSTRLLHGGGTGPWISTPQSYSYILQAITNGQVRFQTFTGSIDNVSTKEIVSNVLLQSVSADRPSLNISGTSKTLSHDGVTKHLHGAPGLNFGVGSWWVCAMINPSTVTADQVIFGKGSNASADNIRMLINGSGKLEIRWGSDAQKYTASTGSVSASTNQILEFGVNASTGKVFYAKNGVEEEISVTVSGTGSNSLDWFTGQDAAGLLSEAFFLGENFVMTDYMPNAATRLSERILQADLHGVTLW